MGCPLALAFLPAPRRTRLQRFQARQMGGYPTGDGREMPGKVEAEEDQRRPPPVTAPGVAAADAPAVAARQFAQVLVELAVEGDVVDHQVGLQVQRQAEGIEIARTDGRPVVVDHRDLAAADAGSIRGYARPRAAGSRRAAGCTGAPAACPACPVVPGRRARRARRIAQLAKQAVAGEEKALAISRRRRAWRIACRYSRSMSSLDWSLSRITRRTRAGCPAPDGRNGG